MRTPGDDFDLAIGHLLTEAMLHSATEVGTLMHCTDLDEDGSPTFNVVDVTLSPGAVLHRPARERTETISSACGVCGSATIDAVAHQQPVRRRRGRRRRRRPRCWPGCPRRCGRGSRCSTAPAGCTPPALATPDGELLVVREDVGRHNAVDKVVGRRGPRARAAASPATVLVVSARASFEIVQKASVAGIPVVVAVGAASSLAVELATQSRHHPRRVRAAPAPVGVQPSRPAARAGLTDRSAGYRPSSLDAIG